MAEVSGAARATLGKSRVAGSADVKLTAVMLGLVVIAAAFAISWAAEGKTPRKLYWQRAFTEVEGPAQDFHDHLANAVELLIKPVSVPVIYPDRTAPGITATMHRGFRTATWQVSDPALQGAPPRGVAW